VYRYSEGTELRDSERKEMIRNMIEIFTEVMRNVGDTELNNKVTYNATMKWI
jgi:hypothetical protein